VALFTGRNLSPENKRGRSRKNGVPALGLTAPSCDPDARHIITNSRAGALSSFLFSSGRQLLRGQNNTHFLSADNKQFYGGGEEQKLLCPDWPRRND